jgi:hypothetical protein
MRPLAWLTVRSKLWPAGQFVNVETYFPLAAKGRLDHNAGWEFLST